MWAIVPKCQAGANAGAGDGDALLGAGRLLVQGDGAIALGHSGDHAAAVVVDLLGDELGVLDVREAGVALADCGGDAANGDAGVERFISFDDQAIGAGNPGPTENTFMIAYHVIAP